MKNLTYLPMALCILSACAGAKTVETTYPNTENFPFEISVINKEMDEKQYDIKIFNKKTGEVQIIEEGEPFQNATAADLLKIKDFNNDGYPDILASSLYPSSQDIDTLYIFNPSTQKFVLKMDDIPYVGTISITKPGCIQVEYIFRTGSYYQEPGSFCWIGGEWKAE